MRTSEFVKYIIYRHTSQLTHLAIRAFANSRTNFSIPYLAIRAIQLTNSHILHFLYGLKIQVFLILKILSSNICNFSIIFYKSLSILYLNWIFNISYYFSVRIFGWKLKIWCTSQFAHFRNSRRASATNYARIARYTCKSNF